jgi:hypothetical protein
MNSEIIILLTTITTGLLGIFGLIIRYLYISKCAKVNCLFGCCSWERDIENEIKNSENIVNIDNQPQTPSNRNIRV